MIRTALKCIPKEQNAGTATDTNLCTENGHLETLFDKFTLVVANFFENRYQSPLHWYKKYCQYSSLAKCEVYLNWKIVWNHFGFIELNGSWCKAITPWRLGAVFCGKHLVTWIFLIMNLHYYVWGVLKFVKFTNSRNNKMKLPSFFSTIQV